MAITQFPIQTNDNTTLSSAEALAAIELAHAGKAYIVLESVTTQVISTNEALPTVLGNWVVRKANGISLQGDSIRNDTGRIITAMSGTLGIHPQVDGGGGSRLIELTSERSPDGIAYTINNQTRPIFTKNNAETYNTKESYLLDFLINEYVRFIAYSDGGLSLTQSSALFRGIAITGPAALWVLVEA
jgi:hypothetical protein